MIVQCKTCGKDTDKKQVHINKFGDRLFCGKPCYYKSISKPKVQRECEQCKGTFFVHASAVKYHGARFCSKGCKDDFNHGDNSYRWVEKPKFTCRNCSTEFSIDNWRTKDEFRGQFCTRQCKMDYAVGEKAYNWRGGTTEEGRLIRSRKENRHWRIAVLTRDGYACVQCKSKSDLHVDHIKPFSLYPSLRTDVNNGRVLCRTCHMKTDSWGGIKKSDRDRAMLEEGLLL